MLANAVGREVSWFEFKLISWQFMLPIEWGKLLILLHSRFNFSIFLRFANVSGTVRRKLFANSSTCKFTKSPILSGNFSSLFRIKFKYVKEVKHPMDPCKTDILFDGRESLFIF